MQNGHWRTLSGCLAGGVLAIAGGTALAGGPAYTITDIGTLPGYQFTDSSYAGTRMINNRGQVIAQCYRVIQQGDFVNQIPTVDEYVGVRYTPGVGLERIAGNLTQNQVAPLHLTEHGDVMGRVLNRTQYFLPSGLSRYELTQRGVWTAMNGTTATPMALPQAVIDTYVPWAAYGQFNASGAALVTWFNQSAFVTGGGVYSSGVYADASTLDPQLAGQDVDPIALNDAGDVCGNVGTSAWIKRASGGFTMLSPGAGELGILVRAISGEGHVCGEIHLPPASGPNGRRHAFVQLAGQPRLDLHREATGPDSAVMGMAWPWIVGMYFDDAGETIGTFKHNALTGQQIVSPPDPFEISGGPRAVNARGEVVGMSRLDIDLFNPWIVRAGTREYFRDLIGDPFEDTWDLIESMGINDRGQVALKARDVVTGRGTILLLSPACPADFNGQNGVELLDIFGFLSAWFSGNPTADFNGQNGVDLLDIFAFLSAWFAGCD